MPSQSVFGFRPGTVTYRVYEGVLLAVWLGGGALTAQTAVVDVDVKTVTKTIDRRLYGSNMEWSNNANQSWDTGSNSFRYSILDQTKLSKVTLLRFPGGTLADYYHWRDGIGPQSNRPTTPHYIDSGSSKHVVGTHEIMDFCQRTGAQPILQVNVATGTAEEAKNWVAYANSTVNYERAANGSTAPFAVKLWEIGNEPYMRNWSGTSNSSLMTASTYTTKFIDYATKMKQADPTIKVVAVGGSNFGRYQLVQEANWNKELLQRAGSQIDFLAVHNAYAPMVVNLGTENFQQVYEAMLAFPKQVERNLVSTNRDIERYAPAAASRIQIAITEWGPLFAVSPGNPYVGHAKTLGSGVYTASMMRVFLEAQRVSVANFFELTDPLFLGSMNHGGVPKPSLLAMEMYSKYFGDKMIKTVVTSPTISTAAAGLVEAETNLPYIEASSSLSADGKVIYVMLINKNLQISVPATIKIRNAACIATTGIARTLTAASPDANNGDDLLAIPGITWAKQATAPSNSMFNSGAPGTVAIQSKSINSSASMQYDLPPVSVTSLELRRCN